MFDRLAANVEHYMDLLGVRQKLVASNIANADTPGYKTLDIDFQHEFHDSLRTNSPAIVEPPGLPSKNDGNNVSLDREARLLAENAIRFNIASNFAKSQIRAVRAALEEGRSL